MISNCYPRNIQEDGFEWCNWSLRPGGTAIVISQIPLGRYTIHYGVDRLGYTGHSFWDNHYSSDPAEKAGQLIIYSKYLQHRGLLHYPKGRVRLMREWADVLALLKKTHGPSTNVTVYPYIGLQHEPLALDGP